MIGRTEKSFTRMLGKLDDNRARIVRALTHGKTYLRREELPQRSGRPSPVQLWVEACVNPSVAAMRLLITPNLCLAEVS